VQLTGAEYVDFSGFEVRNATRIGICGWGARGVRVLNNDVHHSTRGGIYFGYDRWGYVSDVTISGNSVHDNVLENQYHTMNGGWAQSIGLQYTDGVRVLDNRVFRNDGEGIVFIQSDNGVARGNEVSDNFSVGIYLDNAQYTTIDGNLVYSSGDTRYYRNGFPAAGIGTANESYSTANPLTNLTITNNIVVDTRWGFYYGAYESGGGLKSSTVANNTFYRATAAMVWLENDSHANNVVQSNIFYQSGGGAMLLGTAAGSTFRANNWYGGTAGSASGTGDVIADPRLVNPGGRTAADYKLTAASPDLQSGIDLPAITSDFFGAVRAARFDIGAHQLSGVAAPLPDTQAPTSPANFQATPSTSARRIHLGWNASSDDTGVASYRIERDGALVATISGTTWTDESSLAWATTYRYSVTAVDAAGNASAPATASATTIAEPPAIDTIAPTTPGGFWVTPSSSSTRMYLAWKPSIDNVGVAGYRIYRNGALTATVAGAATEWTDDNNLRKNTTFTWAIEAFDAAGNVSTRATFSARTKK
jgi:parallel beta-helix repeat protein